MSITNRLVVCGAILTLLVSPLFTTSSNAKPKRYYQRHDYGRYPPGATGPLRRNAEGDYIDRDGWRYRTGIGWDNTCLNLDYLPSAYACSNNRR